VRRRYPGAIRADFRRLRAARLQPQRARAAKAAELARLCFQRLAPETVDGTILQELTMLQAAHDPYRLGAVVSRKRRGGVGIRQRGRGEQRGRGPWRSSITRSGSASVAAAGNPRCVRPPI
jgi:hypothetical protein